MKADQIQQFLNEQGVWNDADYINPNYTIHTVTGGLIDTEDVDGPWNVVSLDRKVYRQFLTLEELELILKDHPEIFVRNEP